MPGRSASETPIGTSPPALNTFKLGTYIILIGIAFAIIGVITIASHQPVTVAPQAQTASGWQAQMLQGINAMATQMDAMDENVRRAEKRAIGTKWLIAGAIAAAIGAAVRASSVKPVA
jgi:hypothetical protein